MRAKEFISESWGIEYYPNPVPMGEYSGPDEDKFLPPGNYKDVSILYDDVDQLLDMGVKPHITNINPKVLLATQPFISNSTGDGALYNELQAYPLVYNKDGKYYILDGHHRSAAAFRANKPITIYLYSEEMLNQGDNRNDDWDLKGLEESADYMAGHCHVMAMALKKLHPDWNIRAHIGWNEEAEDDEEYRVDHVYVIAPDGTAYDCRGKFSSEEELVGPDETGGVETQFVNYSIDDIKNDVRRGELKAFSRQDIDSAIEFAKQISENFDDGKKPGRKGLAKRVGVNCKQPVSKLRKIAKNSSGEKQRMAHWCANMKSGRKK